MDEPTIFHLCYGVIVINKKTERYIIATVDTEEYPLVFLREWIDDPFEEGYYYSLYGNALTMVQANEIFGFLASGNTRKAGTLLKRYFRDDDPYCECVGLLVLDDMIPDEWYDVWKEMEGIITSSKHITGYWEYDVETQVSF